MSEYKPLQVKMFGTFSMSYDGTLITGKNKSGESQFMYLMQMLLHAGSAGVSRDMLQQNLFRNKDLENVHHSTQSVLYNAKKRLRQLGLPDVNYIEQRSGTYYWTDLIPVEEDARRMEEVYAQAEAETDPEKKRDLYLDAVHIYTGEFLESQTSVLWAAREARKYRALFAESVEKAARLLREQEEYFLMEDLGLYATKVAPLSEWETLTMEALIAMSRYDDAILLYEETVDFYMSEMGLKPSDRMQDLMDYLGKQMDHRYEVIDEIQRKLIEADRGKNGGYLCSYPIFRGIYQVTERMMERGGQSVYLMLCTIVDSKGNPMREGPQLEELSERLRNAIFHAIRRSDIVTRYGPGQYLVLLSNTTLENCKVVQKRINMNFIIGRQRTGVKYYVNSVLNYRG